MPVSAEWYGDERPLMGTQVSVWLWHDDSEEGRLYVDAVFAEAERINQLMQDTIDAYTSAADYGVAEVTTAATFRLAQVYETFGADLMGSERPGNLDEAALEQYELLLEEQVYPFEEKAIDLYKANTDRAPDGVYDEWVQQSFDRLAGLMAEPTRPYLAGPAVSAKTPLASSINRPAV